MTGPPRSAKVVIGLSGAAVETDGSPTVGACAPDIGTGPTGTSSRLSRDGDTLVLSVEAGDTASLRAALNAHLRCLSLALDVTSLAGDRP